MRKSSELAKILSEDQDLNSRVGRRVRQLRQILNLSQKDLASKVSISYQQLQKYELGQNNMSINMLDKISQSLNESLTDVMDTPEQRIDHIDITKLILDNVDTTSANYLKDLNALCSFLNQGDTKGIREALLCLVQSLEKATHKVD